MTKWKSNQQKVLSTQQSSKPLWIKTPNSTPINPDRTRSFRVVPKNIHPSTDVKDIKQALKDEGHEVTNIWNVKQRNTNKPLPIRFVDLKPHTTNKDLFKITTLLNTVVKFETPHTKRNIPQCTRSQKYGHTKNYCLIRRGALNVHNTTSQASAPEQLQTRMSNAQIATNLIQQTTEDVSSTDKYSNRCTPHCKPDRLHNTWLPWIYLDLLRLVSRTLK